MIGWIQGNIIDKREDAVVINVQGVGYDIFCARALTENVSEGQTVSLHIYTHVREDVLSLFGFETKLEKELFLQLIKVSGVGAKTALSILSTYKSEQLISMIGAKDTKSLCAIKGIGKKAAEKIILELADKMKTFSIELQISTRTISSPHDDLVSALVNLGYKQNIVEQTIATLAFEETIGFDIKFKETLKHLSQ
ncbi:MAG: Holliday junction branch migration protein RuvA [Bdellovibrionales bacterium]|nr:Holliday junction branch migration protein RuvA [Bdellovibrionales bacterium]